MNKELTDRAWACLPREFKEEVKKEFREERACETLAMLITLFGYHNLTSDAEGEEMLTVPRKTVLEMFAANERSKSAFAGTEIASESEQINHVLFSFFGSKCLPDEEQPKEKDCDNPLADKTGCRWRNDGKCAFDSACYFEPLNPQEPKPAEPKFAKGSMVHSTFFGYEGDYRVVGYNDSTPIYYDCINREGLHFRFPESDLESYTEPKYHRGEKVRYNGYVYEVEGLVGKNRYALKGLNFDLDEDMIEPCTELEKQSRNLSQEAANCDKSNVNRLKIAAMAMQGILAAGEDYTGDCKFIAMKSLELADAVITEAEKGGLQ